MKKLCEHCVGTGKYFENSVCPSCNGEGQVDASDNIATGRAFLRGMTAREAVQKACEEPTLLDALAWIAVWESERVVRQAHKHLTTGECTPDGKGWDTCFKWCFELVLDNYDKKRGCVQVVKVGVDLPALLQYDLPKPECKGCEAEVPLDGDGFCVYCATNGLANDPLGHHTPVEIDFRRALSTTANLLEARLKGKP